MIRLAALLLVLLAGPAAAHGTLPGGGGFAGGFLHPFVAAEHLLLLFAMGSLIGRQQIRLPVAGLLAGLGPGFALGSLQLVFLQPVILTLALIIGGALAANLRMADPFLTGLALLVGLILGMDTDVPPWGAAAVMAYGGAVTGVLAIVLNCMAIAQCATGRLNAVPLRVAGSWIAASALLILAFLLREALHIA